MFVTVPHFFSVFHALAIRFMPLPFYNKGMKRRKDNVDETVNDCHALDDDSHVYICLCDGDFG